MSLLFLPNLFERQRIVIVDNVDEKQAEGLTALRLFSSLCSLPYSSFARRAILSFARTINSASEILFC